MKTRFARQLDLLKLRRLLNDSVPVLSPSPLDDARALTGALLIPGGETVWITEDSGGPVGCAQARPRKYVFGWELVRMYVKRKRDDQAIAAELIQEILEHLQERGIPRLFGRTKEDSHGQDLLSACGFTLLLRESIFVRPPLTARAPAATPVGLRYRMPQDDWPLRQLENGQTPQLISQLEGLTSASWSAQRRHGFNQDDQTDLIIEREGDIVGWAGWSFIGPSPDLQEHARLSLLTDIEHPDLASPLLDYALYSINSKRPGAQIIVRVRDYQEPLQAPLLDHGFVESERETVLIKHGRLEPVSRNTRKLFELVPAQRTALSVERV